MTGATLFATRSADGYEFLQAVVPDDYETLFSIASREVGSNWVAPQVRFVRKWDDGSDLARADLPWLVNGVLAMRGRAIAEVAPLLEAYGGLLPLHCDSEELLIFSPKIAVGVLDVERSEIVRYPSSGNIMMIKTARFHSAALDGLGAFRLSEDKRGDMYLADHVAQQILATGLTGGTAFVPA